MTLRAGGVRPWVLQRLSALYMALFLLLAVPAAWLAEPLDFSTWHAMFTRPWFNVATTLFCLALLGHAWVGGRDILLDYVHPPGLRFALLCLLGLFLLSMLVWLLGILLPLMGGVA